MVRRLRRIEYDYYKNKFTELGIESQEVENCNHSEVSSLINKKWKKLSLKHHPDKTGGKRENFDVINKAKKDLLIYIKPLNNEKGSLILLQERQLVLQDTQKFLQEYKQFSQQIKTGLYKIDRSKYKHLNNSTLFTFFILQLLDITSLVSYLYLGIKLFNAANFTAIPNILFSATLFTAIAGVALSNKTSESKILTYTNRYYSYFSGALLVVGLVLQYQSNCMDYGILIGVLLILGCDFLSKSATEIYERGVDSVKRESTQITNVVHLALCAPELLNLGK